LERKKGSSATQGTKKKVNVNYAKSEGKRGLNKNQKPGGGQDQGDERKFMKSKRGSGLTTQKDAGTGMLSIKERNSPREK